MAELVLVQNSPSGLVDPPPIAQAAKPIQSPVARTRAASVLELMSISTALLVSVRSGRDGEPGAVQRHLVGIEGKQSLAWA